jgi:hypothetical protein
VPKSKRRNRVAVALTAVGALVAVIGFSAQFRPRSNFEDNFSWAVWAVGMAMIGAGATTPRNRLPTIVVAAIATPFFVFGILVALFWGSIVLRSIID